PASRPAGDPLRAGCRHGRRPALLPPRGAPLSPSVLRRCTAAAPPGAGRAGQPSPLRLHVALQPVPLPARLPAGPPAAGYLPPLVRGRGRPGDAGDTVDERTGPTRFGRPYHRAPARDLCPRHAGRRYRRHRSRPAGVPPPFHQGVLDMKILVTGGAGFIASHVVDRYLASG